MNGRASLHCLRYLLGMDEAKTQTSYAERELLAAYAQGRSSLLEIGVFEGVSTRRIASAMSPAAELYAVDPFFPGSLGISWSKPIARREIRKANGKRIHFIEATSESAFQRIDCRFDFIFIDADHSFEAIHTDWLLWSQRCCVGGVIALHDTRETAYAPYVRELGSFKYYNEFIRNESAFREIDYVDTLSIVERIAA